MLLSSPAPAKLNLYLKIVARRADGFHNLAGLMVKIPQWCDYIHISPSRSFECFCSDLSLPQNQDNLAGKAALIYAQTTKIEPKWHVEIKKNLPCGAGLGGGSSDAATVLKLLNSHYCKLSKDELAALALKLGADVPFFLEEDAAWAEGVGEILSAQSVANGIYALVIKPEFDSLTKEAYQSLNLALIHPDFSGRDISIREALSTGNLSRLIDNLHNDFAVGLESKYDWYGQVRQFLCDNGLPQFSITGSGSAGFVLSNDPRKLETVQKLFDQCFSGHQSHMSRVGR